MQPSRQPRNAPSIQPLQRPTTQPTVKPQNALAAKKDIDKAVAESPAVTATTTTTYVVIATVLCAAILIATIYFIIRRRIAMSKMHPELSDNLTARSFKNKISPDESQINISDFECIESVADNRPENVATTTVPISPQTGTIPHG